MASAGGSPARCTARAESECASDWSGNETKIALDQDYIDERLPIAEKEMIYRQVENSFTQPNAAMNIQMLEWALDVTKGSKGDLLELYCGNGNFSLALARNFDRVLATEIAKPSVAAAQYNIAANHIDNVQIIRMAAEEFTQAMNGVREFNRLQGIDLKSYQCETILSTHRAAVWTVKPRKWCRRIHVFCISPAIRKRYARIWKH